MPQQARSVLAATKNLPNVPDSLACLIGSGCTSVQQSANLNKIFYASSYPGGDVGAKINAADAEAGITPADIWVTATGNVSTVPSIRSNHRLVITVPLIWTVAPVLNNNTEIQFSDNELVNSRVNFVQTNNSGFDISRNRFSYTFAPARFSAIKIPGQVFNYGPISVISSNTFTSKVSQPRGTFAIDATITDANFSDILLVRDNTTQGFADDAKFVANSRNTGISPAFIFMNNSWGANSITKSIVGRFGRFLGTN